MMEEWICDICGSSLKLNHKKVPPKGWVSFDRPLGVGGKIFVVTLCPICIKEKTEDSK